MKDVMVKEQVFYLSSSTNQRFGVRAFLPMQEQPKALLLIVPGMAEHAMRYKEFASFLVGYGYGIYSADHPGSGLTAESIEKLGLVPSKHGWETMLENIRALYTHLRKEKPDVRLYLMGHSMGSVLARHFMAIYPVYVQGLLLSGSFEPAKFLLKAARICLAPIILIKGENHISKWFNKMFYMNLNRRYRKGPTHFEWISSVREETDAYVNDPLCGFNYSLGFYKCLLGGLTAMKRAQQKLKYRKTLPLLNICGKDDPVGNFGKDIFRIHADFYRQRFQNITTKVFPGRHELIHDEQKERVFAFILNWLEENLRPGR